MLCKLTVGLVAAASLGAMALAPSAASAHPWGGGWHGGWGGYHPFYRGYGVGFVGGGDGCYVSRQILPPFGYRWRTVNVCY